MLPVLAELYGEVLVPERVALELKRGLEAGVELPRLDMLDWISIIPAESSDPGLSIAGLGPGELGVLDAVLAGTGRIALLDDLRARAAARALGLSYTGTLGLLAKAYRLGLIGDLNSALDALELHGFRISRELRSRLSD